MTAYRRIISIFLLFGIVTNCFNQWLLVSSYSLNKTYIATVLCSNLDHPAMHCEGKCFLDKKLEALEKKKNQDQENLKRMVETFALVEQNLLDPVFEIYCKSEFPEYLQQKPVTKDVPIFQPPKIA